MILLVALTAHNRIYEMCISVKHYIYIYIYIYIYTHKFHFNNINKKIIIYSYNTQFH